MDKDAQTIKWISDIPFKNSAEAIRYPYTHKKL